MGHPMIFNPATNKIVLLHFNQSSLTNFKLTEEELIKNEPESSSLFHTTLNQ